jgi:hypothetical protein
MDPSNKKYLMEPDYIEAAKSEKLVVEVTNYVDGHPVTPRDLIRLAFTANFTHGLGVSTYGRTSYAIWLLADAAENGQKMKQRDACALAGVTEQALSMALKREKDKAEKDAKQPVSLGYLSPEDQEQLEEFIEETDVQQETDKLTRDCKSLVAVARRLFQQLGDDPTSLHILLKEHVSGDETVSALAMISGATHRPW